MQSSTRKISAAIGVAVLTLSFSGFASAKGDDDPYVRKTEVSYTDLDLDRVADAQELYSRIERAALTVCRAEHGIKSRTQRIEESCKGKAINGAVEYVSNPNLTSVYLARAGKRSMVASSR